jgi:hypothetical protein
MYTKKNDPSNLIPKVEPDDAKIKLSLQVDVELDWNTYLAWQGSTFAENADIFNSFNREQTFLKTMSNLLSNRILDSVDEINKIRFLSGSTSDAVEKIFSDYVGRKNKEKASLDKQKALKMIEDAKELLKKAEQLEKESQ